MILQITAHEAHQAGLVTKVFPHETLHQEVWPQIEEIAQLPPQSLQFSKALYREHILDNLKKVRSYFFGSLAFLTTFC